MRRNAPKLSDEERHERATALLKLTIGLDQLRWQREARAAVPKGWAEVERENPAHPPKTKLTLRLDADVARFFRTQGEGYQARVNAVLRAYMLAKLAELA
jgi:uncharacterized protein (DUF4415 family)